MTPTAYKNLVKKFNSGNRGIHCGHISFLNKIDEIHLLLSETKIDILAITETHLHDNITDTDIDIDDYSIIRKEWTRKTIGVAYSSISATTWLRK